MGVTTTRIQHVEIWPDNVVELDAGLHWAIEAISDSDLRGFCRSIFDQPELRARFLTAPASEQNHHAFPGGLAMHSLETFGLFNQIAQIGLPLDEDDLNVGRCACLLHDLGKALPQEAGAGRHSHEYAARKYLAPKLAVLAEKRPRAAALIDYCICGHREQASSSRLLYAVRQADITSACINNESIANSEGKRNGDFITLRTNGPQRRYFSPAPRIQGAPHENE